MRQSQRMDDVQEITEAVIWSHKMEPEPEKELLIKCEFTIYKLTKILNFLLQYFIDLNIDKRTIAKNS